MEVSRRGNDLTLSLKDGSGSVRIQEHFSSDYTKLDEVEFADGTKWSAEDVASRAVTYGTDEGEVLGKVENYRGRQVPCATITSSKGKRSPFSPGCP